MALASGVTAITSRSMASKEEMVSQLTQRLADLGRAHDLVRPLKGGQGKLPFLEICSPFYSHPTTTKARLRGAFASHRMGVGESSAASLPLVIHELATTPSNTARSRWKR
ncbi:hypothetical protein [Rhizobium leguminosarum]|uniref:hypothetical protein n=1 Tax=Rhizobium leguminosarum TaxID=384 RepID=UPI0028AE71EA|nr:hypothetical protein [Rhizobium leguminosarum]